MTKKQSGKIKYTGFVVASIDGKIAQSSNSGTSWTSKEDWAFFQKSLTQADAVIVGRNTFKLAKRRLMKRNTIVLTSRVGQIKVSGSVFFLNPEKSDLKSFLASKKYKNIAIVGGPKVYNFCLEHGMLDELFVTIEPYVFSAGVPMFSGSRFKKHKFTLLSVKRLNDKGTLLLKYKHEN